MTWPIPWRRIEIASPLSPAEVEHRLATVTQRRWLWFVWPRSPIQFIGPVSNGSFRVLAVARGRNTYAAWVLGRIEGVENGSRVAALLTLHPVAIAAVLAVFVGPQILGWLNGTGLSAMWGVMFLVFHTVMYYVGFQPEARRAERALRTLAASQAAAADERRGR